MIPFEDIDDTVLVGLLLLPATTTILLMYAISVGTHSHHLSTYHAVTWYLHVLDNALILVRV